MRRSELERLEAAHIDFEHGVVTVQGAKSNAARRQVPIEPALLPLLKKLVKERPSGPLLDVPDAHGHHGAAAITKMDLAKAKFTRPELHRDDDRFMPYTFRAYRHTAITHWAVAGKSQLFLLTVAGHLDVAMTKKCRGKAAAAVSSKFGKLHPELPPSLLGGAKVIRLDARSAQHVPIQGQCNLHAS